MAMAVAVKQTPQTAPPGMFDRLSVAVLAGMVYVLGSFAIVLKGLPYLWYDLPQIQGWDGLAQFAHSFAGVSILVMLMLAAAVGLFVLGVRLLGPHPAPGVRAG